MLLKIVLLVAFIAVTVGIGIYARKSATDVNGFVLAGRSVGPWLTAFAYGTSYFSAVIFVGYAGQFGWRYGVSSTWVGLGNAFLGSLLAWVVLGRRTRLMTQSLGSRTMPDFFGLRFKDKNLKLVASVITFIFLIPYTASLFNGLSRLFNMAFPGVPYEVCVIAMAILTGIYVIAGGYMATAINDFIQGIIMIIGIVAVVLAVLNVHGGFVNSLVELAQLETTASNGANMPGAYISFFGPEPLMLLGVVLLTSLGTWGLPQMVGKFYAIRDEDAVRKGTIISTIFAVIVAGGCYFLGGFGRLFITGDMISAAGTPVGGYDSVVPTMLSFLPDALIAVVLILVLSASMSTLSSLVLTSSSTMTLDFIGQIRKDELDEKKKLVILRSLVAVFIVISAAIAILQYSSSVAFIAQLMGVSWGALAGSFLAPFMYGLYWKKTTKASVWASYVFGVGVTIFELVVLTTGKTFTSPFMAYFFASPINAGVLAMVGGLIIVPIVSLLTPKMSSKDVDPMFTCYDTKVSVRAAENLAK
ncbi:MAG: sodium:solute symporter [Clostridia bacterium]|nr:sodium:solute symporter [Clostridia bacterium]